MEYYITYTTWPGRNTHLRIEGTRQAPHGGNKPITHGLQNQEGSICMCGVGRKNTMQAGQRGTCQHSQPASHAWAPRAHNIHHMAGSKPVAHQLQNQAGSRCMCGVGRKKTKQGSQRGRRQHSQPASHAWASRAHNKHHMAGSKLITHQLQNQEGSRCRCGVGRKNTMQSSQRAHASIAGQHHSWNTT